MKILIISIFCGILFPLLLAAPPTNSVPQAENVEDSTEIIKTETNKTTTQESGRRESNQPKGPAPKTICIEQRDHEGRAYMHCENEEVLDSGSAGTSSYPSYSSPPASSYGSSSSSGYGAPARVSFIKFIIFICENIKIEFISHLMEVQHQVEDTDKQ